MKIGITDTRKPSFEKYVEWLKNVHSIETVKLSYELNNAAELESCNGVLITGGEDVHPKFYDRPEYLAVLDKNDIDEKRDEFEMGIIRRANEKKLPLLAICRGLQIMNVTFGGTLIPDLPKAGYNNHRLDSNEHQRHILEIVEGSFLENIVGVESGEINSRHHQAIDTVAHDFSISAISDDGVAEAIEWKDPQGKAFFLGVQWHPERMNDFGGPFSQNIANRFLEASKHSH